MNEKQAIAFALRELDKIIRKYWNPADATMDTCMYTTELSNLLKNFATEIKDIIVNNEDYSQQISGILDKYLPAEGAHTLKESLRMNLHQEICIVIHKIKEDSGNKPGIK